MSYKLKTVEDFFYENFKVEKDTTVLALDAKVGRSRTGILVQVEIQREDFQMKDWIDLGMVFPMSESFTVPKDTDPEEYRKTQMVEVDNRKMEYFKKIVEDKDLEKLFKVIDSSIAADKYGL